MKNENLNEIVKKIEELKKGGKIDLSEEEDLAIAVMNLVSLEEHLFFTSQKTGKDDYLNMLESVREIRKNLMARLIPKNEGETWCVSKHLLSATMRLIEVGTKLKNDGKNAEAKETFDQAYSLFSVFWAIRLKIIKLPELKNIAASEAPWTLKDIVNKLVDCCDE